MSILALVLLALMAAQERKSPKKPGKPFTVYVFTEGLTNEAVDMTAVAEEVRGQIAGKKSWLRVVTVRDEADVVVEVLTHVVQRQHRTRLDQRVDATGVNKSWVDENFVTEWHTIESRVELPNGTQTLIQGMDQRDRGASAKRAASNLANRLEDYLKEHYWEVIE